MLVAFHVSAAPGGVDHNTVEPRKHLRVPLRHPLRVVCRTFMCSERPAARLPSRGHHPISGSPQHLDHRNMRLRVPGIHHTSGEESHGADWFTFGEPLTPRGGRGGNRNGSQRIDLAHDAGHHVSKTRSLSETDQRRAECHHHPRFDEAAEEDSLTDRRCVGFECGHLPAGALHHSAEGHE